MRMGPQEEDYIETVFTCKGDYNDPNLHLQLEEFYEGLRSLLLPDSCQEKLILKKVEPWNSVRVTFNIPRAAALKLKQLAQQGDTNLRRLGVLAVQIEGDQSISLTIAGKNNERTELVFRTGVIDGPSGPKVSVFDTPIMSAMHDVSDVEATRKNIADYLRQGHAVMDSLLPRSEGDVFRSPNVVATSSDPIPFHSGNSTVTSSGRMPSLNTSPLQHTILPPGRSPTGYPTSPSQSYPPSILSRNVGQLSPKYNYPAMGRQVIGNLILPPPPPYPHSQVVSVNNIQKPTKTITSSSPLLVNLLQNDPSGGLLNSIMMGKLPGSVDGTMASLDALVAKKKRKKKKKKRLAAEAKAALLAASMGMEGTPNPTTASTSSTSLPGYKRSLKKPKPSSEVAADYHSTYMADFFSFDPAADMADKLVNPYTGHLEPAEGPPASIDQQQYQHHQQQQHHHHHHQQQQQHHHQQEPAEMGMVDTIQATINRVAAAWPLHVTSAEDTVSTKTSTSLASPSLSPLSTVTATSWTPFSAMSGYPQPSSTIDSTSPVSALPLASSALGSHSETPTSTAVCDRPIPELYNTCRPSTMNFPHSENYISEGTSEPLHKEPLLGMQHVAFSVGLPQVSKQGAAPSLLSTPSHMHPQRSMQRVITTTTTAPIPSHTIPRPSFVGGHPDSFAPMHGLHLPGGLSPGKHGNVPLEKTNNSDAPFSADGSRLHLHRKSGTPPFSSSASTPVAFLQERPRSTGSYPLAYMTGIKDKNFGKLVSDMPHSAPPRAGTNVLSLNPGSHASDTKHTHIRIQASGQRVSPGLPNDAQGPAFIHVTPSETQPSSLAPKTELGKGSEEISNSNHDSGLSSQSEPADDNQLTDETASSCGTQGSPPSTVSESAKRQPNSGSNRTDRSAVYSQSPMPQHLTPHHKTMSGNQLGHGEVTGRSSQVSCSETRVSPSLAVHSKNIDSQNVLMKSGGHVKPEDSVTVLHWNTRDGIASSGSHVNYSGHADRDSIKLDQQNLLCRKQPETVSSQERNRFLENYAAAESQHLLQGHGMTVTQSPCQADCRSHSHLPPLTVTSEQHRTPVTFKEKAALSPALDYTKTVLSTGLDSRMEAYEKFIPDVGRNMPITTSSNILYGYGPRKASQNLEGGVTMQPSAMSIGRSPLESTIGAQDIRAPSTQINTSSASQESRLTNTFTRTVRPQMSIAQEPVSADAPAPGLRVHQRHTDSNIRGPSVVNRGGSLDGTLHSVPPHSSDNVMDSNNCQPSVSATGLSVTSCPNMSSISSVSHSMSMSIGTTQGQMSHPANRSRCVKRTSNSGKISDMNDLQHGHSHLDLINCAQSSASQPNTHMCNITEAAAAYMGTPQPPTIHVSDSHLPYTTHSHATISRTQVSQSPHKTPPLQKLNAEGTTNGPIDCVDALGAFPDDLVNCHGSDYFSQKLEGLDPSFDSKLGNLTSLPVLPSDILDQELWKNYSPAEKLDIGQSIMSVERNLAVPQGILTSGRSSTPGIASAIRQSNSPDPQKGSNVTSMYTRKSPTGNAGAGNMLSMFSSGMSGLPLPKRLTESIQKLVKPLPPDVSRNQAVRKSPSQKQSSLTNSPPRANIHSHNTGTAYPRSPPLAYESALQQQGISSVLTPPKSPVRAGLGDGLSVGSSKPVSPRALSPSFPHSTGSTSPFPQNPPMSTSPNLPVAAQLLSTGAPGQENDLVGVSRSKDHPAGDKDHQAVSNNTDGAYVQSWNGATSQISGQQQSLHEQSLASAENNSTYTLPVMLDNVDMSRGVISTESNTRGGKTAVVDDIPREGGLSTAEEHISLGETGSSLSGDQVQTSVSVNTEISEEQDLCKANLSCSTPPFMHPESVSETREEPMPSEDQHCGGPSLSSSGNCAGEKEPPPTGVLASSNPVSNPNDSAGVEQRACQPLTNELSARVDSNAVSEDFEHHVTSAPVVVPAANTGDDTVRLTATEEGSFEHSVPSNSNNSNTVNAELCSTTSRQTDCSDIEQQGCPAIAPSESETTTTLNIASGETEIPILPVTAGLLSSDNYPTRVSQQECDGQESSKTYPLPSVTTCGNDEPEQTMEGVSQSAGPLEHRLPNNFEHANYSDQPVSTMPVRPSEPDDFHCDGADDHTGGAVLDCPPNHSAESADSMEVWAKPEEEPPRQQRSTRRSNSQEGADVPDSPVPTKALRGGKTIERDTPRPSRTPKTLRRKSSAEEETGAKTSPESDASASPQLRQRGTRSRRKLPEHDDNPADNSVCKRSKVDGNEDLDMLDQDGEIEGKDNTPADQNDVMDKKHELGGSVDQNPTDSGVLTDHPGMENIASDASARNISEDKLGSRQVKETRKLNDNSKHVLRDSRREVKVNDKVNDNDVRGRGKVSERSLRSSEEEPATRSSRGQQTRRNKLSPSGVVDKSPTRSSRDRSPVRGTRNRTPDQMEESNPDQQYKRTTRSTKPKEQPEPVTAAANRRRRSSRDHR